MIKAEFSASLLQSSASHDPSEIILICWFAAQDTFLIIINVENVWVASNLNGSVFIYIYIYIYIVCINTCMYTGQIFRADPLLLLYIIMLFYLNRFLIHFPISFRSSHRWQERMCFWPITVTRGHGWQDVHLHDDSNGQRKCLIQEIG